MLPATSSVRRSAKNAAASTTSWCNNSRTEGLANRPLGAHSAGISAPSSRTSKPSTHMALQSMPPALESAAGSALSPPPETSMPQSLPAESPAAGAEASVTAKSQLMPAPPPPPSPPPQSMPPSSPPATAPSCAPTLAPEAPAPSMAVPGASFVAFTASAPALLRISLRAGMRLSASSMVKSPPSADIMRNKGRTSRAEAEASLPAAKSAQEL
mmetsp:Transcript_118371/g.339760  ORF Transcript_118371/g.339760 Transcript_118371/m.339760 type:complete len:213 (-) Transcript_118371:725-1363(-)